MRNQYFLLLNSATVIDVAIAAFRDSEPGSSAGYGGMYNLSETSSAIASDIPLDSLPITITEGASSPLLNSLW